MAVFVNRIDDLIDKSLDRFFTDHVQSNKLFTSALSKEVNFVKYQTRLHELLDTFIKSIDSKEIATTVVNKDNVQRIFDIIKRYVAYYCFLWVAVHYVGKRIDYINNVVELGKGAQRSTFRITNFYNSDNNATLFRLYDLIRDMIIVISTENIKSSVLGTPEGVAQYRQALDFSAELGDEYVKKFLKIRGVVGIHNLIKTMILVRLYQGEEKMAAIKMLQESEMERGEYTYIEIIMPRFQHFDYAAIENLLTTREIRSGLADELYEQLNQPADIRPMSIDEKIDALMQSGILVPVVEDFLLMHKDTERYERSGADTAASSSLSGDGKRGRGDDTRLRYIVSKLDAVSELFSAATRSNQQRREQIEKLMYAPMRDRRVVLINELEEIKIMNKIENQGKQSENIEFYHDLLQYRSYPYVSFKSLRGQGFTYRPSVNTVLAVRSTNFEFTRTSQLPVETRSATSASTVNVVGFIVRPLSNPADCLRTCEIVDVRNFTMRSKRTGRVFQSDNGYLGTLRHIRNAVAKGRQDSPAIFWGLDIEKDKFDLKGYEPITSSDNMQEYIRLMVAHVYDSVEEMLVMRITEDLKKLREAGEIFSSTEVRRYILEAERRTMRLSEHARQRLGALSFTEFYPPGSSDYDIREDIYPGYDTELHPNLKIGDDAKKRSKGGSEEEEPPKIQEALVFTDPDAGEDVLIDQESLTTKIGDVALDQEVPDMENSATSAKLVEQLSKNVDYQHAICEHVLIWQETVAYQRNRELAAYEESLYNFIQTFVRENADEDYVCKSCDEILPIKRFVVDGVYDDEQQRFITFAIPMDTPLEEAREYEKYAKIIKNIDRRLERICDMLNMKFYVGASSSAKWRRRAVVKNVLDLLLVHNRTLKSSYKKRKESLEQLYGIGKLSNLFIFEIDDTIFDYSSRDRDFFRLVKLNNITAYILFALFLEIDEEQIATLGRDRRAKPDKLCNIDLYERVAPELFKKLQIIRNLQGDRVSISNIPNFCYTLFITSCILARNRTWFVESTDAEVDKRTFDPNIQKSILHTVIDLINSILEVCVLPDRDKNWIYGILGGRFMSRFKTLFESVTLEQRLASLVNQESEHGIAKLKKMVVPKRDVDNTIITPSGAYKFETITVITPELEARFGRAGYIAARDVPKRIGYNHERRNYDFDRDTNCPDGQFHKWVSKGSDFQCDRCKNMMSELLDSETEGGGGLSDDDELRLLDLVWSTTILHMAESICINGDKHNFETLESSKSICSVCSLELGGVASLKNAKKMEAVVLEGTTILEPPKRRSVAEMPDVVKKTLAILPTDAPVRELTAAIEAVLGKDAKLQGSSSSDQSLYDDTYIAEYDYLGNRLTKAIIISSRDGKLHHRTSHPHFHSSVLYYTDQNKEVDVYYDAITHAYLGFRERNREYVNADSPHYLKVRWSLKTELELLGFSGMNMRIDRLRAEFGMLESELAEPGGFESLMAAVYKQRLHRITQTISEVLRIIYRIHHGYAITPTATDSEHRGSDENKRTASSSSSFSNMETVDRSGEIVQEFGKSLANINVGEGDNRVFAEWDTIMKSIPMDTPPVGERPEEWVTASDMAKDDASGKMAIHYLTLQFTHLLKLNSDKFTAVNLINLITRIVNYVFNLWNSDAMEHEYELKRFLMRLDMKRAYEAAHETASDTNDAEAVVDSTGENLIQDYIESDHLVGEDEKDEMFSLADIDGGKEMEDGEEPFLGDFRPDEIAD